jgi:hypothetical protein
MARSPLPITNFQTPDGNPVVNGYVLIRLSDDGMASGDQIQSNFTKLLLDSSGNLIGTPLFWPNASITPAGSYYIIQVYEANGQLVSGPNKITV